MADLPHPWRSLAGELASIVSRITVLERRQPGADASGIGVSWPEAPIPFAGLTSTAWGSNAAGAFGTVSTGVARKASPRVVLVVMAFADGTAAGLVRAVVNGTQLGTDSAVPNGSMPTVTFGPYSTAGDVGDTLQFSIDTRVTSGTGKVYAQVISAYQVGS